jgi:predicted CXXCH cytochrome family protein
VSAPGGSWDWTEIGNLQVRLDVTAAGASRASVQVDEVYYVVNYAAAANLDVVAGSNGPSAKFFSAQGDTYAVDDYDLTANDGDVTVTQFAVRGLDTFDALTTDVTGVELYEDDGDNAWDAGDTQIGTTQTFSGNASGSTVTFSGLSHTVTQGTTDKVWVVFNVGSSAVDGHIVGSELQDGDITVSGGQTVNTFTTITSANSGQTIEIDATGPTVSVADPTTNDVLTGSAKTISGTASDAGLGLNSVDVRVQRSDGNYWNGSTWVAGETWNGATGTSNWTYSWSLDAGQQSGDYTYTITARADDTGGNIGTSPSITGVTVDNVAPQISSATAVDSTHVDVVWDEDLDGATIAPDGSDFTISGLTITAASLDVDGVTVHLTTSSQTASQSYTVQSPAGNVADLAGNTNALTSAGFTGFVPTPVLTVAQGSDAGRPTAKIYRTQGDEVAVDEIDLTAANGDVTVASILVRGLDTVAALTTDVTAVRLFEDDGDGTWDAGDIQVGTTRTFPADASGSSTTFGALSYTVTQDTTESLWIVYTIGGSAADGNIVGSELQDGDVTASGGATVTFVVTPITSAGSGQTIEIDTVAPTVSVSDPGSDETLTGSTKLISGTASDARSGVTSVDVRIQRSDGQYWNGTGWTGTSTWNPATGTTNWTYSWSLDAGQQAGDYTYTITAQAQDDVGLTGTSLNVSNVTVDNVDPVMNSATAIDATHVDVVWSEELDAATIAADGSDFSITGLTITAASLDADGVTVHLTTSAQTPSQSYSVQCAAGNVADSAGNTNPATSQNFTGFGVAGGTLVVTQGTDSGRPTAKVYDVRSAVAVVDEFTLEAIGGPVTVSQIAVRGLDTVDALTTDVSAVRLFEDNGDGTFSEASDTQVGSTQTFGADTSGTAVTFGSLSYTLATGETRNVWIVYTIGASAVNDHILGSRVEDGDIVASSGTVQAFTDVVSADTGQTIHVDAAAPSADTSDPLSDAVLIGSTKTISGTASDGSGSGVSNVTLKIQRSDGNHWNGSTWIAAETWSAVSGTTNWTYSWSLDAAQDREFTYTITARATDGVGQTGIDVTPVTNVRVDNTGPVLQSATALNGNTVDATFSEPLDPSTVAADGSDFSIAGLTISAAVVQSGNEVVRLTTDNQTPSQPYTLQVAASGVSDAYSNPGPAGSAGFVGYGGGADTDPPTVPGSVVASPGAGPPTIATITWTVSTDNVGVTGYRVWRSLTETSTPVQIGTTTGLSFDDESGIPGQSYWYSVSAYDASGNESARSPVSGPVVALWTRAPHATYTVADDYCRMCHSPHVATNENLMRNVGGAPGELSVCYSCHDGQGANANVLSGPTNSFALASGHAVEEVTTGGDLTNVCSNCHAPHTDWTTSSKLPRSEVNSTPLTGADNSWCFACHNDANDWYGPGYPGPTTPSRDASGYPVSGPYPGETTYSDTASNPHASIPASASAGRQAGDCLYCHESHRGDNKYDALTYQFRPTTPSTVATDLANGVYAESCFNCHGGVVQSEFTTAPTDIKQFVTAGGTRSGHQIKTAGGNLPVGAPLPCYDCHNPHGTDRGNASLITDELGQSLETSTAAGTRAMCLACHSSSDGQVWDSVGATYAPVPATTVEGLRRDGSDGSVLKLPTVNGHDSADTVSCYQCHGNSYSPGGANVHNPSGGVSAGGEECYSCHGSYQAYMEDGQGSKVGANRTSVYHHVMGSASNDGDIAPNTGTYPTSNQDVYCVSCHTDHNYFDSSPESNLRQDIASTDGTQTANTDYLGSGSYGICISCHSTSRTKDTIHQKDDGTTNTQPLNGAVYGSSAHQYPVTSEFGLGNTFSANCSKCHNDEQTKSFQTSANRFSTHWSAERRLLESFGVTLSDPVEEEHCYGCHSAVGAYPGAKTVAGRDWYGSDGAAMSAANEEVYEPFEDLLGSQHPVKATASGSVECENCHNPHRVNGTNTVSDPDNTLVLAPYSTVAERAGFCMTCHDGTAPAYESNDTTYVPHAVTLADPSDDKTVYSARGHWTENGSIGAADVTACGDCHDNHGSNAPKLLGEYDAGTGGNYIGSTEVSANDNDVCSACHTSSSTSFPAGEAQREAGTGYVMDGTWPGLTTYNTAYVPLTNTGNGHTTVTAVWPGTSYPGGDCKNCHDVHGTANTYDELRTENAAGTDGVYGFAADDFSFCFNCHDTDGPAQTDIKQYYPAASGGTSSGDRAGHQIVTNVVGANLGVGDALPCYDCHNPHGSASAHMLQVRDIGDDAGELNVSTADGVRKFCLTCHATSDTDEGWNGAAYAVVGATEVEGFRRDGSDGSVLGLPSVNGHGSLDTQSCYDCHGNDATSNVHSPTGGLSDGGQDCYGCHSNYRLYMEDGQGTQQGTNRTDNYHHVMGSATNDGDNAFAAGSYPSSSTDVYCLSCHVDHDKFNDLKSGNLRADLAANPASATSDYLTTGSNGICVQCHGASLDKDTANQKDDGSTTTPKIVAGSGAGGFENSAHLYPVTTSFADGSTFDARCSKCHSDEQVKDFQTSTNKVGTHWSATRRILNALGGTQADPLQEEHCYRCHSETGDAVGGTTKTTANRDWYDSTAMTTDSERVYQQFQKTSTHPVVAAAGDSVECESCHNAHVATAANPTTDPDNTYDLHAYGTVSEQTSYCLTCHDAGLPSYVVNSTTYVPYSVTQADTGINDKTTYAARSHWTAYGSIGAGEVQSCAECHDNHGSDYPKLLGAYDSGADANRINATAISGNNNTVCAACHTSSSTGFPAASRDASGYPDDGTWPGTAVYNTAYNSTAHTGSFHLGANGGGNSSLPNVSNGDCKVCHDVHGTINPKDELNGVSAAASFETGNYALCFDCHDTDGPGDTNVKTYYPGTVGGSGGGSGHEIVSSGGNLPTGGVVPCYDCHNPHGTSNSSYGLMVVTMTDSSTTITLGDDAGEIAMSPSDQSTASNVRNFCFACHTTSDTTKGWNGSALAVVGAGATVEGLDRTTGTSLKLPDRSGHREADGQSCYSCHGDNYATASSNNVHNPSGGVSAGGKDCYTCHTTYQTYMEDGLGAKTGSSRTTVYHHVMGSATNDGDNAFGFGSYPTSSSDLYCLSCHVDHDRFNPGQSSNLRITITGPSPGATNFDYLTTGNFGVCVDCHDASLTKDTTNQLDDGSTNTPVITGGTGAGAYGDSAHQYTTTSSFGDATTFNADCSKCHNDENSPTYKDFQTSTDRFGPHWSATRRVLSALGGTVADPIQENHCYRCHAQTTDFAANGGALPGTAKPAANRDWYDATAMTNPAERVYAQFQLASKHPVVAAGGDSVECESCHNAHVVSSSSPVTDPDNGYNSAGYTDVTDQPTFCLKCHDGALPSYAVNGTTYVPYSVTQANSTVNNKSTYGARGHWSTSGSIAVGERVSCAECHDNHGSSAPKLLGAYDMADNRNEINGQQITTNDNTVCAACHTSASSSYPAYTTDANGYPDNGTWPGTTVYSSGNGIHRGASVIWPGTTLTGGDCKNCHDVHGTANTKDELRTENAAGTHGTYGFAADDFTFCFNCHDSDGPAARDIKQFYPTTNGGDQTQGAGTGFGHKINTSGGNLTVGDGLPCYDCHNPHGSGSADGLLVVTMTDSSTTIAIGDTAGEIDMSDAAGVREFCFSCHTTSDNTNGWNGSAYAAVSAGAEIEGIDRTTSTVLNLPVVSGHASTDTQSCYGCHGQDYSSSTANNVHNPGPGGSNGGIACLNCHGSSAAMRLDKMVNDTSTYHHVLDDATPDSAPNTGAYPTSQTNLECVSCHTDHNYFNSNKGANLRTSITNSSGASNANSDFISGGSPSYGVCISCHTTAKTKNTTGQKTTNASSQTKAMSGSAYDLSEHDYNYAAAFGSDTFNANCSKCHDDEQDALQTYQTSTYKVATHYSADARVARALGASLTTSNTSTEENLCLACHSGAGPNDGYGAKAMSARARGIQTQMAKIDANPLANMGSGHDVTSYSGLHTSDEYNSAPTQVTPSTTDGWWGSGNADLHVECEDCHDPHQAQASSYEFPTSNTSGAGYRTPDTAVAVSNANKGVWGVTISGSSSGKWAGSGAAGSPSQPTYDKVSSVTYEWQLCLKCHSSYAWGTNTPPAVPSGEGRSATTGSSTRDAATMTDVGLDFNPSHYAFHPVFQKGRNQPPTNANSTWTNSGIARQNATTIGLANTMTDGWFTDSLVTCSDCHGNSSWGTTDSHGVHGSDQPWILRGVNTGAKVTLHSGSTAYPNATPPTGSGNVCINCHRADVYGYGDGAAPSTNDDTLSRHGHLGSGQVAKCGDGVNLAWAPAETGCFLCHGGRGDDGTEAVGVAHGSSMGQGDGSSDAADGNDAQDGSLSGAEMGKRFMNGAGWDHHTLGDQSGSVGCSTIDTANTYSDCTNHNRIDGKTATPEYYYQWQ